MRKSSVRDGDRSSPRNGRASRPGGGAGTHDQKALGSISLSPGQKSIDHCGHCSTGGRPPDQPGGGMLLWAWACCPACGTAPCSFRTLGQSKWLYRIARNPATASRDLSGPRWDQKLTWSDGKSRPTSDRSSSSTRWLRGRSSNGPSGLVTRADADHPVPVPSFTGETVDPPRRDACWYNQGSCSAVRSAELVSQEVARWAGP